MPRTHTAHTYRYWLALLGLCLGISTHTACQCTPGVVFEGIGKERTGGGTSSADEWGLRHEPFSPSDRRSTDRNSGEHTSSSPEGSSSGESTHTTEHTVHDGGSNSDASSTTKDGGIQWPPEEDRQDTSDGCGQGRTLSVPASVCSSQVQVCVQKKYVCSPKVELRDGRFVIEGQTTFLRGVVYDPVPKCKPYRYDFTDQPSIYKRDFALLRTMGQDLVLRTTRAISTRAFLDEAYQNNLNLIVGFAVQWQQNFAQTCPGLRKLWKAQLHFYQRHPAIIGYAIGEQVSLHIMNSNLPQKNQRIRDWFTCLNQLAGDVRTIEGIHHRPVATVSGAHPNERMGDASVRADETTLSNVDFHLFQVFADVQVNSWLRGPVRTKLKKPVVIGGYGVDACDYQASTRQCRQAFSNQTRAMLTLARDTRAAFDNPLTTRAAGGLAVSYSDALWAGEPASDLCGQNASGYAHGFFPDGFFNLEWFGLVDIHTDPRVPQPRPAFRALSALWNGQQAWAPAPRSIQITSHSSGMHVQQQFLVSGTFTGFQKQSGEDWAAFFILIRPYQSSDHYPMVPIALCCGFGPQEWMMALQVGRKQDVGKKFELIPAYTTQRSVYEHVLKMPYFITKPQGLTLLKKQSILVTRR